MGTSWREWILDFVWVMVWFVRAVVWYLAGCAITFMILAVPYLSPKNNSNRGLTTPTPSQGAGAAERAFLPAGRIEAHD